MKYLYIANWKMYLSVAQSINFVKKNHDALLNVQKNNGCAIIICPSFIALDPIITLLHRTTLAIGAQNCSEHQPGAYTGEISVQSLSEIGATYCIVGHSERRQHYHETNEVITKKTLLLLNHAITPIICIGETHKENNLERTYTILMQQLENILSALQKNTTQNASIIIAYEPVWTIGTGIIPDQSYLNAVFDWLKKCTAMHLPTTKVTVVYGGSVNATTIAQLKKISAIEGFLIGSASTDFEQFANIIQSNNS